MGLNRAAVLVALVACVVSTVFVSTSALYRPGTAIYPRQRRGSDQRLAELEALLTLSRFIKEKQAQDAMFENIGKRRKRQLANDGLLPIEDNEYSAGGGGNSAALDLLESLADAWNGGPSAGSVLAGSFAADDGSTSETMANADPALKYPWNRYKQSGRQQQQADISRASLTAAQQIPASGKEPNRNQQQ